MIMWKSTLVLDLRRGRNFGQYNLMKNFLESILDFGCGTGETTAAMANGAMGQLGSPAEVNKWHLKIGQFMATFDRLLGLTCLTVWSVTARQSIIKFRTWHLSSLMWPMEILSLVPTCQDSLASPHFLAFTGFQICQLLLVCLTRFESALEVG